MARIEDTAKERARRTPVHRRPNRLRKVFVILAVTASLAAAGTSIVAPTAIAQPGPSYHLGLLNGSHGKELTGKARDIFSEKSCEACHANFADPIGAATCGTAGCHPTLNQQPSHPFEKWTDLHPHGKDCRDCHREHGGAVTRMQEAPTPELCGTCHEDPKTQLPKIPTASEIQPDKRGDAPFAEYAWLFETFSHQDHETGAKCADCHRKPEQLSDDKEAPAKPAGFYDGQHSQFAPVSYKRCLDCHRKDSGGKVAKLEVEWHGSGDETKCLQCHTEMYKADLIQPEGDRPISDLRFTLTTRSHSKEVKAHEAAHAGKDCRECHKRGVKLERRIKNTVFPHELHVSDLSASTECADCHTAVVESGSLNEKTSTYDKSKCADCHKNDGGAELIEKERGDGETVTPWSFRFPHDKHFLPGGAKKGQECHDCHHFRDSIPVKVQIDGIESTRRILVAKTEESAKTCVKCHSDHQHIAGNDCSNCHGKGDPVFARMIKPIESESNEKSTERKWRRPIGSNFDHWSTGNDGKEGHKKWTEAGHCVKCHDDKGDGQGDADKYRITRASSLDGVPVPIESWSACMECHVDERQRFHWQALKK